MKINGVIILRNPDLKRFFDLSTFWNERESFVTLIDQRCGLDSTHGSDVFFDNDEEHSLYKYVVRPWMLNEKFSSAIEDDCIFSYWVNESEKRSLRLDRLSIFVAKANNQAEISKRHLLGLTGLYLMLGANSESSNITPNFNSFIELKTGVMIDNVILLSSNRTIKYEHKVDFPITCRILANVSDTNISISTDKSIILLKPGQCVTGIFHNQICHKLFPNSIMNYESNSSMVLNFNTEKNTTFLSVAKRGKVIDNIEDVTSFTFDNNGSPIYTTLDGKLHIPTDDFTETQKLIGFQNKHSGVPILAVENNKGSLNYYTTHFIYY